VTTGPRLFSLYPPAFAAVPQYLVHITVELLSLSLDRIAARAVLDGEFPKLAPFRYVRRVHSSTITHVSASLRFHPGRSDFPSPVGDHDFPLQIFP
jgi:hypothetical protein